MRNTKNLKRKRRYNKRKLSEKIEVKRKLSEKKRKKQQKSEKKRKKRKNVLEFRFALFCFDTTKDRASLCIPIERVKNSPNIPAAVTFLGLYFDTELNFKHHIKTICTRVSRALNMLRTCKNFLSEKSLKILYYYMVHCHLVYGNQIWGCANASLITELFANKRRPFASSLIVVTELILSQYLNSLIVCRFPP